MKLYLTPKNIGLISRLLQLQLPELFRTLTQASRSLLLLKGSETKKGNHLPGVHTKLDVNRFRWKFILINYDSKRLRWTKKSLTSVQGINPLQTWAKNFQLPSRQPTSSVFVGKVSAMLEVVLRKNNDKPLKQFLSSHDREVILLIFTAAQWNLADFFLTFKDKSLVHWYLAKRKS